MNPLQIFEKHPDADAYRVGGFYSPYALVSTDKRFTDAELAAEWWATVADVQVGQGSPRRTGKTRAAWRAITIHRFATLPHFDA